MEQSSISEPASLFGLWSRGPNLTKNDLPYSDVVFRGHFEDGLEDIKFAVKTFLGKLHYARKRKQNLMGSEKIVEKFNKVELSPFEIAKKTFKEILRRKKVDWIEERPENPLCS